MEIEKKLNTSHSWWLPIVTSAILAAGLAYIFSRLAAKQERSVAASKKKFARAMFPNIYSSLKRGLNLNTKEIDEAVDIVASVSKMYHLKRSKDITSNEEGRFDEEVWVPSLANLGLSSLRITIPDEPKRFTRNLKKQLSQFNKKVTELNTNLGCFSLMSRVKTFFEQPDGDAVDKCRKKMLEEGKFKYSRELVDSDFFQTRVADVKEKVKRAAKEAKTLNSALLSTLEEIRQLTHDT